MRDVASRERKETENSRLPTDSVERDARPSTKRAKGNGDKTGNARSMLPVRGGEIGSNSLNLDSRGRGGGGKEKLPGTGDKGARIHVIVHWTRALVA